MAMTGGTPKLVKSGTPSGWPGSIKLYMYYKIKEQSAGSNTTTLLLGAYITTPSGYWLEAWADNRGSYVGTATSGTNCKSFDGSVPYKTQGTYWLTENQEVTVSHNADGTKTATLYWKWGVYSSWGGFTDPSGSFTVTLPAIPRASGLTAPASGTLLSPMGLSISAASSSFRHRLLYAVGNAAGVILEKTSAATSVNWTPPASLAAQNTAGTSLSGTITLETYADVSASSPIGTETKQITLGIPSGAAFAPIVSAAFSNLTSVPAGSVDILLQNKSRVKAAFTQQCQYGATLKSAVLSVAGGSNSVSGNSPLQTGILTGAGSITVNLTITDSRGLQTTLQYKPTVYAYANPTVGPASGESGIRAERCDQYGNWDGGGTWLRVKARAGYTSLVVNGRDLNSVTLRYRYRATGGTWNAWAAFSGDTGAVSGSYLYLQSTYQVEVGAVDALGYEASTILSIGTEEVFMHQMQDALGIGMYVTGKRKTMAISPNWKLETGSIDAGGNVTASGTVKGATVQATGNITAGGGITATGSMTAGGNITATGDVSGANLKASGTVSGGKVQATGSVSGANVSASGQLSGASGAITGNLSAGSLTVGGSAVADSVIAQGVTGKWRYRKWKSGTVEAWNMVPSVRVEGNAILTLDVAVPGGIFPDAPGWISTSLCSSSTDPRMGLCNVMADSSGHTATTLKLRLTNGDDDYRTPRIMIYAVYYTGQEVIS